MTTVIMIIRYKETIGHFYSVKQSDSPSTLYTYLGGVESDNSTNYYDTPTYVVDVLGGAMSKSYRRLTESRNPRHIITILSRAQVVTAGAACFFVQRFDTVGEQQ